MIELFRRMMGLPPGASSVSDGIDTLHAVVAGSTLLLAIIVFSYTLFYVVRYRRRSDEQPTERLEANRRVEFGIIGFVTLAFVGYWVVGFAQYGELTVPPADADTVYVDAKQWMWKFGYPSGRSAEDVLTVPVNKPIKLVMTSRDVIHSFYVPAFRVKQDVIPGRTTLAWFKATQPGTYPIYCAEYCGVSHSAMLGSVKVLSQADYDAWQQSVPSNAAHGEELAHKYGCIACHSTPNAPKLTGHHDDAFFIRALMEPKGGMPSYREVLEPGDLAAILDWLRGLK